MKKWLTVGFTMMLVGTALAAHNHALETTNDLDTCLKMAQDIEQNCINGCVDLGHEYGDDAEVKCTLTCWEAGVGDRAYCTKRFVR